MISSSHDCVLHYRVVSLAMGLLASLRGVGKICSLIFVYFEEPHLGSPFQFLDILLASFDCHVICIYGYSGWASVIYVLRKWIVYRFGHGWGETR